MASRITIDHQPGLPPLQLSNGLTAVFLSVLALAGAPLASRDDEIELLIWLAARDQTVYGMGCVGFDVSQLPWHGERLEEQKQFLCSVIDAALVRARRGNQENLIDRLALFRHYIETVRVDSIRGRNVDPLVRDDHAKCPTHEVYLHREGCIACNDGELRPVTPGSKPAYFL